MPKRFWSAAEHWDEATDVLIIGSGFAGLSAAYEAARAGAEALVLEKMPYYGGNSALAGGGYACWDSGLKLREKLELGEDSWQLHMQDTMRGGKDFNLPELVEVMVKNAPEGLDFLTDAGIGVKDVVVKLGGHSAYRGHHSAVSGKGMVDALKRLAEDAGAKVRLGAAVNGIFRDGPDGPVLGVEVTGAEGTYTVRARKAVLIASGGFGQDVALRTRFWPALGPDMPCSNHRGATGEVIGQARAIGADALHMAFVQLFPCGNPKAGTVDCWAFHCYSGAGVGMIYVDQKGKRFISELACRDEISEAQMSGCEKPTFSILNRKIAEALQMPEQEIENGVKLGRMIQAETMAELEKKLGMPEGSLTGTVAEHNAALEQGSDPAFGKPMDKKMIPLSEGPFYAIPQWPTVHYTMGGLRIDADARVLDVDCAPIPRLYAAGEVCGGIHGSNRLAGNAIAECVVYGRIAGRNAAGETPQNDR